MTAVLLIEDNPGDQLLFRRAFDRSGVACELDVISDGQAAQEHLAKLADGVNDVAWPRLVLLDLELPRLDGRALLAWIRSRAALRGLVVVVVSTSCDPADVALLHRLGANSVVQKPATLPEFDQAVRRLGEYWLETAEIPDRFAARHLG